MPRPRLDRVLETVLYFAPGEEEAMERFYGETLGLRRATGRAFRLGDGLLLLFDRETAVRKESPPPHGTTGAAHVGFAAAPGEYDAWRKHLAGRGVPVLQELTWEDGLRSFYFHDPAGNVLEIAEGDMWPPGPPSVHSTT
jgi:catechol 2,3-dioxygenase-like lactoylglutathione lyase family enzyme